MKTITVECELLKQCEYGFDVWKDGVYSYVKRIVDGKVILHSKDGEHIAEGEYEIKPEDYEKNCINRINSVLGLPLKKVEKIVVRDEPENLFSYLMAYDIDDNDTHICVDPRPHIDEYVINL